MDFATRIPEIVRKLQRNTQTKTVGIFARLELRRQIFTISTFLCSWLVITWSVTLKGLLREGATSKPHHCRKKLQKIKDLP